MRLIGLAVALAFSVFVAPLLFELAAGEAQQTGKVFRIGVLSPVPLEQLAASIPEGVANQRMVQDRAGRFSADDPGRCADYRYGRARPQFAADLALSHPRCPRGGGYPRRTNHF